MASAYQPKSERMRALYWTEEILQVMFWIRGEGFGESIDSDTLGRFLGIDADEGLAYVDKLVDDGYLTRGEDGYTLTDEGLQLGARVFSDEFAELTKPSHGECGLDCWCHSSSEEAQLCAEERAGARH